MLEVVGRWFDGIELFHIEQVTSTFNIKAIAPGYTEFMAILQWIKHLRFLSNSRRLG